MNRLMGEELISFTEAAKQVPGRAGRVRTSTLRRWASKGTGGAKLEAMKSGSTWLTSRQAVARFLAAVNAPKTAEGTVGRG